MQLQSTLICPKCAYQVTEAMPTDACQFFYDCNGCGTRLKPKPGDCCVFVLTAQCRVRQDKEAIAERL